MAKYIRFFINSSLQDSVVTAKFDEMKKVIVPDCGTGCLYFGLTPSTLPVFVIKITITSLVDDQICYDFFVKVNTVGENEIMHVRLSNAYKLNELKLSVTATPRKVKKNTHGENIIYMLETENRYLPIFSIKKN